MGLTHIHSFLYVLSFGKQDAFNCIYGNLFCSKFEIFQNEHRLV